MKGYILICKTPELFLKALNEFRKISIDYQVDQDAMRIYFNVFDALKYDLGDIIKKSCILETNKAFLRTTECHINENEVEYSPDLLSPNKIGYSGTFYSTRLTTKDILNQLSKIYNRSYITDRIYFPDIQSTVYIRIGKSINHIEIEGLGCLYLTENNQIDREKTPSEVFDFLEKHKPFSQYLSCLFQLISL